MERYISSVGEFDEDEFREYMRAIVARRVPPLLPSFDKEIDAILRDDVSPRLKKLLDSISGTQGATVDVQNQAEYVVAAWVRAIASRAAYVRYKALMERQGYSPLKAEHFDPQNSGSDTPFIRLQELSKRFFLIGSRWRDPKGRIFIAKAVTPKIFISFNEEGDTRIIPYSPLSDFFKSLQRS